MKTLKNTSVVLSFAVALLLPIAAAADEHDDLRHHRYWDREHHDYHRWNRDEDRYWRLYWTPDRGRFIAWNRANEEQRQAYWHWRHEHHR